MNYQIICGFGVFHNVQDGNHECKCEKTYGYSEWKLQKFVLQKYGFYNPSKITKEMRREYYHINHAKTGNVINNQK